MLAGFIVPALKPLPVASDHLKWLALRDGLSVLDSHDCPSGLTGIEHEIPERPCVLVTEHPGARDAECHLVLALDSAELAEQSVSPQLDFRCHCLPSLSLVCLSRHTPPGRAVALPDRQCLALLKEP